MYPSSLHFIKYKKSYLGTYSNYNKSTSIIAFIKLNDAKIVKKNILYENFQLYQYNNKFLLNNNPLESISNKPIKKKLLRIYSKETPLSIYYTLINNTNLRLIDDIKMIDKNDKKYIELLSNYKINFEDLFINESMIANHMNNIYYDNKINYSFDYLSSLVDLDGYEADDENDD